MNFSVNSPVTVGTAGCKYRVRNGVASLHLHVAYAGSFSSSFVIATLPSVARPVAHEEWGDALFYGPDARYEFKVETSGNLLISRNTSSHSGFVMMMTYLP